LAGPCEWFLCCSFAAAGNNEAHNQLAMVICADMGLVIDSLLEPEDGLQISVEEVEVEVPLHEALVSISGAPPAILGLSIEPPLPDTVSLRFSLDSISVAAEDMLCVPDWVERRSLAARMIERVYLPKDEESGARRSSEALCQRQLQNMAYGETPSEGSSPQPRSPAGAAKGSTGAAERIQELQSEGALLFVDHTRYERIRLCLDMGEGAKGVEAGSGEPAKPELCTAAHVVKIRGLNICKRTGDGLEWFMF
jgi:hypothetical protein